MTMPLLVMLNSYFHDLAVAFFFSSSIVALLVWRQVKERSQEVREEGKKILRVLHRLVWYSGIWIFLAGILRTMTYRQYEWVEAARKGQVWLLGIKHLLLGAFFVAALIFYLRVRRESR